MEGTLRHLAEPGLKVIETLGHEAGQGLIRGDRHLARAARTCAALGFPFAPDAARAALQAAVCAPRSRLRLTIDGEGRQEVTCTPMTPPLAEMRLALHACRLRAEDPYLAIKTTHRALYDQALQSRPDGVDEVLFANTDDALCEGAFTNLFFTLGADPQLRTPPRTAGLLPGILREALLETGACVEAPLPLAQLGQARLWVGNSLRGLIPARMVAGL